jgi:hypothetical protein
MRYRAIFVAGGLAMAAFATAPAAAAVLITVDKSTQQVTVQVDGATRWQWKVSTGRIGHDTPNGTYHALYLDADHHSKKYDDAPMPHSIFFTELGHALHGTFATRQLGAPASHGCVRLEPANATQLFALVKQEGPRNTTIVITGDAREALARPHRPATPAAAAAAAPPAQVTRTSATATVRDKAKDDLSAPLRLYPAPVAQPTYRQAFVPLSATPPVAPPSYPPFPRPGTVFGD